MAAYATTVVVDLQRAERIGRRMHLMTGTCDITNYNTTGAEITDITKWFSSILRVVCDGMSVGMFNVRWNTTDKCFHAFYPFYAGAGSETAGANNTLCKTSTGGPSEVGGSGTAYGQPGVECATDLTTIGIVNFFAFGIM